MMQAPGELIAAVRVNGLEQPAHNPQVHSQDMQVARNGAPEDRGTNGAETKHQDFNG